MSSAMIGVIGGSGLYAMPDLKNPEEVRLTTPFGDPSDAFIIGELKAAGLRFCLVTGGAIASIPAKCRRGPISMPLSCWVCGR